ncbi:MAG: enolase C-terminal domain-like protein [Gemmatimonadales bacterium]
MTTAEIAASAAHVDSVDVALYRVPTDAPESDGTLEWNATTLVAVEVQAADQTGFGYTYADTATAVLIRDHLAGVVRRAETLSPEAVWELMFRSVRNLGQTGIAAMAISAVDIALWDLGARIAGVPLVDLLGPVRERVACYGSGGFTSYPSDELAQQLRGWIDDGFTMVKMKVGRDHEADPRRVARARAAIGPDAELFVDANGGYRVDEAREMAYRFMGQGVTWFEEPVPQRNFHGLAMVRASLPPSMELAAGEYGYVQEDFEGLIAANAVDVLQIDVTRCGGITAWRRIAAAAQRAGVPMSAHCAPSLHVALGLATPGIRHLEYFHDHVRIEQALLDGAPVPDHGTLCADRSRTGLGLELKRADAERFRIDR